MFDLTRFGLSDAFELSVALPELASEAADVRHIADSIAHYLYDNAIDKATGERSLVLVQSFAAAPFAWLPPDLQDVAATSSQAGAPHPHDVCLTLLATAGDEQPAIDPRIARSQASFLLTSPAAEAFAPVVAHVMRGLQEPARAEGILRRVAAGHALALVPDARRWDVLAPWTGVLVAYGIRSAFTMTARMDGGLLFTVVAYAKEAVPERTVDALAATAVAMKLAVLPALARWSADGHVTLPAAVLAGGGVHADPTLLGAQNAALLELLHVRHDIALNLSNDLEQALALYERRASDLAASQAALARSEARSSAIVRSSLDAVVVMDAAGKVEDWNPAAAQTFGYARPEALGELVADLIVPEEMRERHARGIENYLATGEGPLLGNRVEMTAVRQDGERIPVELTITPVRRDDGSVIFTAFVRDITEQREQRAEIIASRENFAHIARTLQRSLLPAALPEDTGLEFGAIFHPSRAGSDVGGDFYDVLRMGRTDVMLTLGDVCGKGPEAAAITAIARYTVRAVAAQLRHPSAVMRRVNSALLDHDIGERFCSMVTVRAVPIVRGVRLSVCCAGHAQPMVVRADGGVERVGVAGDLLGLFPEVKLMEETVQLGRDDSFVLFTDGVTEAMRGGEQFGEARLAETLQRDRHLPTAEMADRLLATVLAFGGEQSRDDIAVLAVRPAAG